MVVALQETADRDETQQLRADREGNDEVAENEADDLAPASNTGARGVIEAYVAEHDREHRRQERQYELG